MKTDLFGQQIFSEMDLCLLYLQDPNRTFHGEVLVTENINIPDSLQLENFPRIKQYTIPSFKTINEFDEGNQQHWLMPKEYYEFDVAKFVLDQCTDEAELQRAAEELLMFQERGMFVLLQYLKYLVDTMRKHNIVWGVGRGSSVASFVLFLLGVHRINSLYYDLSIDEFLK